MIKPKKTFQEMIEAEVVLPLNPKDIENTADKLQYDFEKALLIGIKNKNIDKPMLAELAENLNTYETIWIIDFDQQVLDNCRIIHRTTRFELQKQIVCTLTEFGKKVMDELALRYKAHIIDSDSGKIFESSTTPFSFKIIPEK
jgi:hypothetical protein